MKVIFTGNVSKGRTEDCKGRQGGEKGNILTQGPVILFMVNTVSTLAVKKENTIFKM